MGIPFHTINRHRSWKTTTVLFSVVINSLLPPSTIKRLAPRTDMQIKICDTKRELVACICLQACRLQWHVTLNWKRYQTRKSFHITISPRLIPFSSNLARGLLLRPLCNKIVCTCIAPFFRTVDVTVKFLLIWLFCKLSSKLYILQFSSVNYSHFISYLICRKFCK